MKITATMAVKRGTKESTLAVSRAADSDDELEFYLAAVERQSSANFSINVAELQGALDALGIEPPAKEAEEAEEADTPPLRTDAELGLP